MKYIGLNYKEVITNRNKYGINELEVVKKKEAVYKNSIFQSRLF